MPLDGSVLRSEQRSCVLKPRRSAPSQSLLLSSIKLISRTSASSVINRFLAQKVSGDALCVPRGHLGSRASLLLFLGGLLRSLLCSLFRCHCFLFSLLNFLQ